MRTATTIEGSGGNRAEITEFACEAEKLGLDVCWVAEAWGADAPSLLGYLAARTQTMLLGSGVIQVGTRSPVLIAQTAMTLAHLSGGRFLLGLGVSGPQVMEGLHGIAFAHPLARLRETVQIVRSVFAGEKISFSGSQYRIPLPGGDGRPMRVSLPPVPVPVYLATLSPKMLELTGEIADGWLGTSFVPEGAAAYFSHLDAGLARAGRARADLDICQGAEVNLVDEAGLASAVAGRKKELAFSLGGMGSATSNFYHDAYSRQGWAEAAAAVRERWLAGDREGAAALVTDEMILATTLIGTEEMVRDRLATWRDTGVDTVRLYPAGDTLAARLDNLGRAIDLVRALGPAPPGVSPLLRASAGDVQVVVDVAHADGPPCGSARITIRSTLPPWRRLPSKSTTRPSGLRARQRSVRMRCLAGSRPTGSRARDAVSHGPVPPDIRWRRR